MKKTLLITGGLGYIGSHGVVAFEEAGYSTVIVDNLSNTDIDVLQNIGKIIGYTPDFYNCDLRDKGALEQVFQKYDFHGVIHFAGLKSVSESCEEPDMYIQNNIGGSMNLFSLMKKYDVCRIIFSSSATVYNYDNSVPYDEAMPTGKITNPYGYTKYCVEGILETISKFSNLQALSLRYFNPIGAHKSGYIGENPKGIPNNLLPYIMKVATHEIKELQVFGDDYNTIDGTGVRDYIDVNDLIDGHVKAYYYLEEQENEFSYDSVNLGVGKGVSVLEMIQACEEIIGNNIPHKVVARREGDLGEVYCSTEKSEKIFGWRASTDLHRSLRDMWNFYN